MQYEQQIRLPGDCIPYFGLLHVLLPGFLRSRLSMHQRWWHRQLENLWEKTKMIAIKRAIIWKTIIILNKDKTFQGSLQRLLLSGYYVEKWREIGGDQTIEQISGGGESTKNTRSSDFSWPLLGPSPKLVFLNLIIGTVRCSILHSARRSIHTQLPNPILCPLITPRYHIHSKIVY